ncbi:L-histidine N(alpha)-methyltransferase [Methanosarcina sp. KYL-1]|uniref:L-histidine N(alpha)-methyltransferase n=1 Tax=Methanosarcina sp. KYL-1 TaxID=2602068 RepID=UPI0021015756|nr:L-histidine N(alpha)-methyltransferase [Methanosarcina sp. KYL-1]MCQ1537183.1 L-histidine N(alpha)-methyltransferase [Methanosarcina sp. KYL-1]
MQTMQQNPEKIELISEKDLKEKLYENLKQHHLPDYLLYAGSEGAKNWLTLNGSENFPVARGLKELLREKVEEIGRFIPSCMNLVSLGVGNGEKERILLEKLVQKSSPSYYAIDISSKLVDSALETVRDLPVKKTGIVGFIEELGVLKNYWRPPVLFCILGNTFCNYEPDFILKLVRENLDSGDIFLFDAHILPGAEGSEAAKAASRSVLGTYASRENALFNMYPLIHYGMALEDFDFELLLSHVDSRIGTLYRTRKTMNILKETSLELDSGTVTFKEGDIIGMGFTYKYTYDQIIAFLNICEFDVLRTFLSEDRTNVIILAKKRT